MADISVIKLPNGNSYNLKDTTARNAANSAVPNTRTVNGKALSSDISLGAGDVGAYTKSETDTKINAAVEPISMTILSYGHSSWDDFIAAYNTNTIVYCRASSSSNPASGSQTRMAFMAYVDNGTSPTYVEFQYYRSVKDHSASQQGDQVYIYALNKNMGWSVTVRQAYSKIITGTGLTSSYADSAITLKVVNPLPDITSADDGKILMVKNGSVAYGSVAWGNVSGRPSSLPANGGNSSTVNGHTVNADVPSGAKFTDTTYGAATQSSPGLMSAADKKKLDSYTTGSAGGAVEVTLAAASWSSSTTEINGNNYYTYSVSIANIGNQHPQIFCSGGDSVIPSATQESEFNHIRYALVDTATSTVTFYSIEKPSVAINVVIKDYLESSIVSGTASVTIATSDWSSTTSTVNGRAFYTAKKTLSSVSSNYPTIICGTADTLPSDAEQTAFDCINYAAADTSTKTVTFYAVQKPTSAVVAIVI